MPDNQTTKAVALEAILLLAPVHWLRAVPWCWEIRDAAGRLLADGEGCRTAAVAIETARITAYEEGWLREECTTSPGVAFKLGDTVVMEVTVAPKWWEFWKRPYREKQAHVIMAVSNGQ